MKEKRGFSIFNSHLDLAHQYWKKVLQAKDWAIDATCGNGHDTLCLARACEGVIGLDIQEAALSSTKALLQDHGGYAHLFLQSHETFPSLAYEKPIRLIVYNLGYLPGADKALTTRVSSSLKSLQNALDLILPGGMVSLTCYPGHSEGQREEEALLNFSQSLAPAKWSVCFHRWKNRPLSPSLLLIQKSE